MRLELRDIHKYYGPVKANCGVNLSILPGTVHGILGENGAGKSTLMKVLAGYSRKTSGTILLNDSAIDINTPAQAAKLGIGMLYQDPLDFPLLSALDNFMLGQSTGIANKKKRFEINFKALAASFNFPLEPDTLVKNLTIGERQQLEIMRLLAQGTRVLILDEPTTGISSLQKETLFSALDKLAAQGKSVVLVSHKIEDIKALCHKITVLRQGVVAGEIQRPFNTDALLEMMFGTLSPLPLHIGENTAEKVFEMERVFALGGRTGLKNCSISFCRGEVIGLAGLEGSGQEVFLKVAAGLKQPTGGSIYLGGERMNGKSYHTFKQQGVSYLPAARIEEGLISGLTIAEHFLLQQRSKGIFAGARQARRQSEKHIAKFRIKGTPESYVESLSGGNQQRLLVSFLPADPTLLLLGNPTRGLDMESVRWVWQHLHQYRALKTCIAFSSSELDEILLNADRVLVFFDGAVIKDIETDQTDVQELGRAIAGKA